MRVAAVQMCSGADRDANLDVATSLIERAAGEGADLVVLPEMFNLLGSGAVLRAGAESLDGVTARWAAAQAAAHGLTLVAGTFIERPAGAADTGSGGGGVGAADIGSGDGGDADGDEGPARNANTCCVYGPDGARLAVYRKIHLFDVDVPGAVYRESDVIAPGDEIVVTSAPAGAGEDPIGLGLSVCYDVRFPELYRIATLRGADVVTVPAAFTAATGPPHWEVLLRARAIENHLVVVAAGQHGSGSERFGWHGHSMIVDPWGAVLGELADGDGVVVAEIDRADQDRIRGVLPSVANRRPSAYRWPS